ncbi:MAG: siphovirus ReqiPepy6 Gp37-like family protein [Clostridium sp.]|uniref:siphovirus ReqiPepy6 Gp37-like family protein n=1 Tax=Clostridium sp. TaxID=1506 RepID=UPI00290ED453|nr:siphovirus ReqiPepy6 Gp37-like family protein [Clostridium sp.]
MDLVSLKILDENLNFIGYIEDYISFYFVRSFFQAKEFQLVVSSKYSAILKEDNYIYLSREKSMVIDEIVEDEIKHQLTIKGRDIKSILGQKLTEPPADAAYDNYSGSAEGAIKHYVDVNCVNPVNIDRKISNLVIAENKNRGAQIKWQSRYKNLEIEAENICKTGGIGWFIYIDFYAKKLIFDVETGMNKTESQSDNTRVVFSSEFQNVTNTIFTRSKANYKNVAYVAGQGEGTEREIIQVKKSNDTGLKRREIFIDARDISESENLQDRGLSKLAAYDYVLNTDCTIVNRNLIYGRDWTLGDIVTVKNSFGINDLRIEEVREIYEGTINIEVTVGTIETSILEQINNSISNTASESAPGKAGGDKSYIHNQISSQNKWTIKHNLSKYPSVVITDSGGNQVMGDVKYIDLNTIEVSFSGVFAGMAYLN